jgi:arylsulfatase A-like enzyme
MRNKDNSLLSTPFATVLFNLLVIYISFMLCRVVFIWYNWNVFSGNLSTPVLTKMLMGALKFDTAGIMYLTVLYMALTMFPFHFKENRTYYIIVKVILIIMVSAGIAANLIDTVYFPFTGCRSTLNVLSEFKNESGGQMRSIVLNAVKDNWYLVLLFIVMVWLLCITIKVPVAVKYRNLPAYYLVKTFCFMLFMFISVIGIRGGISTSIRPITMSNAYQYADRPADAAAVLNTPFCVIRTAGRVKIQVPDYFSEEELEQIYTPVIKPDSTAVFTPKNVVIFILESFGGEYVGYMNKGVEGIHDCTPFLDSLMEKSLTFEYSFANGRKSIDASPSVLSGIPMLKDNFVLTTTMMSKEVSGLAEELDRKGYYSAYFHGADNQSMGFQSYARAIGYKDYFGMDEFDADPRFGGHSMFDGVWAIWDEEFLQFMCATIGTFREPFLSTVFTATSHHPFNVPDRYKDVYPPEPNLDMYHCIRYSDNALRLFFEKASKEPWFKNTLFVLTADHTNQSEHPAYQSEYGKFRIPIIFYDPSGDIAGHRDCIAQQSDIQPSILGYLGYDKPIISFGQNLFATPDEETWAANYMNGMYMYYKGDWMIKFDGEQQAGLFAFRNDPALKENLKGTQPQVEEEMIKELKALIQQYLEHMTTKELVIPE